MSFEQLLFGVFSGDSAALTALFFLTLPFVLAYAGAKYLINRIRNR